MRDTLSLETNVSNSCDSNMMLSVWTLEVAASHVHLDSRILMDSAMLRTVLMDISCSLIRNFRSNAMPVRLDLELTRRHRCLKPRFLSSAMEGTWQNVRGAQTYMELPNACLLELRAMQSAARMEWSMKMESAFGSNRLDVNTILMSKGSSVMLVKQDII